MYSPIDDMNKKLLRDSFIELENSLGSDLYVITADMELGLEEYLKECVEENTKNLKKNKCFIILTSRGGLSDVVERLVLIFRNFYDKVDFIIPNYAYSAGTIFCMSGNNIYMNYYSVLGPVDPQVQREDGTFVPALGYLDKLNEMLMKAQQEQLSEAEFIILRSFDLAEVRTFEQAHALAKELIITWLVKYKFSDWRKHSNGAMVTEGEKLNKANEIANILGDANIWKTHSRGISKDKLLEMGLKILDYSLQDFGKYIDKYYSIMSDYRIKYNLRNFIQTRERC